jgi:poly-gamma-glutamate capsule biosynthesis protein CapA/YwtB (metallophosphatase superfamily)
MIRILCATALLFAGIASASAEPSTRGPTARVPGDIVILVAGDLLGPYDTTLDPASPRLASVAKLIAGADAVFANQEGSSFDVATFKGSIAAENGGGYPIHSLATMRAFRTMGLNLISRANNHATDWGAEGMIATDLALDAIGFAHAGTGASLTEARAPAYLQTRRGTVALVAASSTFPGMSPAGDPARGAGPRPGLNPLHVEPVTLVSRPEMQALRAIVARGGWQGYELPGDQPSEIHLNEKRFRVAEKPGLTYDVSTGDRNALLDSVSAAREKGGLVIFSIHAHETLSGGYEDPAPADFLPPLFHDVIDRGAALVARHGPHAVQGIEIYKGRPIFYGLGHLFFDLPRSISIASEGPSKQVVNFPEDWWDGAIARVRYSSGKLTEIRVYPLAIKARDGPERGVPTLATGTQAKAILKRIQDRSSAFGTKMRIDGEVGVIDRF